MTVVHFVTDEFVPRPGGLEISLLRTAQFLAATSAFSPIVYIRSGVHEYGDSTAVEGVAIVPLAPRRASWEAPLLASDVGPRTLGSERSRLDFLLLRNLIGASAAVDTAMPHVIVSFFLMEHSFVAQQVAAALQLPHVACIRGTDYSRGFHDPLTFPAIDYVAHAADLILATNTEQRIALERRGVTKVRTIIGSVTSATLRHRWRRRSGAGVRLFANCGYSHKKGTQVLLHAFAALRDDGFPVELTITGADDEEQRAYWSALRDAAKARFGSSVTFLGHVAEEDMYALLLQNDVYCSASLGEGCSLARLTALAIGMLIVTTRCGEIPDIAADIAHVRVSPVADEWAFLEVLRRACRDVLGGSMRIDEDAVDQLRRYLTSAREQGEWVEALDGVSGKEVHAEATRVLRA